MSLPISISKTAEQLPIDPLLVVTRAAIGLGLGILMADKIKPSIRQVAAIAVVLIGALAAGPCVEKTNWGKLIDQNRSGGVAPGCAPFGEILVTAPITTSIEVAQAPAAAS